MTPATLNHAQGGSLGSPAKRLERPADVQELRHGRIAVDVLDRHPAVHQARDIQLRERSARRKSAIVHALVETGRPPPRIDHDVVRELGDRLIRIEFFGRIVFRRRRRQYLDDKPRMPYDGFTPIVDRIAIARSQVTTKSGIVRSPLGVKTLASPAKKSTTPLADDGPQGDDEIPSNPRMVLRRNRQGHGKARPVLESIRRYGFEGEIFLQRQATALRLLHAASIPPLERWCTETA